MHSSIAIIFTKTYVLICEFKYISHIDSSFFFKNCLSAFIQEFTKYNYLIHVKCKYIIKLNLPEPYKYVLVLKHFLFIH